MKTEELEIEQQKIFKYMLKSIRNAMLDTHDWYISLLEKGALTHEDIRELRDLTLKVNEKLRVKLAKRYGVAEFK